MRLLEFEQLNEKFTPQIEGYYDVDDIMIWFQTNYSNNTADAWVDMVSSLATAMDDVQRLGLVDRYKRGDIDIVNDFISGLMFQVVDLQYYKNKAHFKTIPTRPADTE